MRLAAIMLLLAAPALAQQSGETAEALAEGSGQTVEESSGPGETSEGGAADSAPESPPITVTGPCILGLSWTGGPGLARIASCEAPEEDAVLTLRCAGGAVRADVALPFEAEAGAETRVDVTIDGRSRAVTGTAEISEETGRAAIEGVRVPARIVERLAAGSNGLLTAGGASRGFHLTGSRNAIAAMREGC